MIIVVGFINGRFTCDWLEDTPDNRELIKIALFHGLNGVIMRV